jgi:hypothetical protein
MKSNALPDGLEELQKQFSLVEIMRLIESTARWVDVETFRRLPLWFPEHARRAYFYKSNWQERQLNKNKETGHTEHKREANVYANKALTLALGLGRNDRPNWSCCHIWGVDDARYQMSNAIVQSNRFYSCVANVVLLPTPLKAFTDVVPNVKMMLRICARNYYGWQCDHEGLSDAIAKLDNWSDWEAYPMSWPRLPSTMTPRGVIPLNNVIQENAQRRLHRIKLDLKKAGDHYPRAKVLDALEYWNNSTRLTPNYNVAPTNIVPIIRLAGNDREVVMPERGLMPSWQSPSN